MSERSPSRVLSTRLPADDYDALKSFAAMSRQSMNEVVVRAVRAYLLASEGATFAAMVEEAQARFSTVLQKLRADEEAAMKREEARQRRRGSSA